MTAKTTKYNQLKINLDESKTPKSSNMPLISSGYSTNSKRKVLTKNFLSTTTKSNNPQSEEKTPFRLNVTSSRSESRNKLVRFNNSNAIINASGLSSYNNNNYTSLMNNKPTSNSIDELKSSGNNYSNTSNFISPNKPKKINIFNNATTSSTTHKHFFQLSTRTNNPLLKSSQQAPINIMTLLSNQNITPLNITALKTMFPNYDTAKTSLKCMNYIRSYGVNTYQGIIRLIISYN